MVLLPARQVQHWLNFPDQLAHVLRRPDEFAPDVTVCSLHVAESVLRDTADLLGLRLSEEKPRSANQSPPPPLRQPPFTYRTGLDVRRLMVFERSYSQATDLDVQLFKDTTTVRFASPVPFRGPGRVLVRLSGAPYALPERARVASLITTGASGTAAASSCTPWHNMNTALSFTYRVYPKR
jgi:hypothetical protein